MGRRTFRPPIILSIAPKLLSSIASSNNGQYLYAVNLSGLIWKSSDYGTSWSSINENYSWVAIECSGDGKNVVADIPALVSPVFAIPIRD